MDTSEISIGTSRSFHGRRFMYAEYCNFHVPLLRAICMSLVAVLAMKECRQIQSDDLQLSCQQILGCEHMSISFFPLDVSLVSFPTWEMLSLLPYPIPRACELSRDCFPAATLLSSPLSPLAFHCTLLSPPLRTIFSTHTHRSFLRYTLPSPSPTP